MVLTEADIAEIERLAYLYMSHNDIATILGCKEDDILYKEEAINALNKGRLLRKAEFNGNVIALSNQLSSPSMAIEAKIAEETYLRDKLNK